MCAAIAALLVFACAAPGASDARFLAHDDKAAEEELGSLDRTDVLLRLAQPGEVCAASAEIWDVGHHTCAYVPAVNANGVPFVLVRAGFPEEWAELDPQTRPLASGEIAGRSEALGPAVLLLNPQAIWTAGAIVVGATYWMIHVGRETLDALRDDNFMNAEVHSDAPALRLVQTEVEDATRNMNEDERSCWDSMAHHDEAALANGAWPGEYIRKYNMYFCSTGETIVHRPALIRWAPRPDSTPFFTFVNTAASKNTLRIETRSGRILVESLANVANLYGTITANSTPWDPAVESAIRASALDAPARPVEIPIVAIAGVP